MSAGGAKREEGSPPSPGQRRRGQPAHFDILLRVWSVFDAFMDALAGSEERGRLRRGYGRQDTG